MQDVAALRELAADAGASPDSKRGLFASELACPAPDRRADGRKGFAWSADSLRVSAQT